MAFIISTVKAIVSRIKQLKNPVGYAKKIGVNIEPSAKLISRVGWGSEPWLISVGANTVISSEVVFSTHDGAVWVAAQLDNKYKDVVRFGRISIGNNCFIGARTTIMPDVSIGDYSVVGACSLVLEDIPSHEVWAGVPARRICSIEEYANKRLLDTPIYDIENLEKNKKEESIVIANKRAERILQNRKNCN